MRHRVPPHSERSIPTVNCLTSAHVFQVVQWDLSLPFHVVLVSVPTVNCLTSAHVFQVVQWDLSLPFHVVQVSVPTVNCLASAHVFQVVSASLHVLHPKCYVYFLFLALFIAVLQDHLPAG